MLCTCPPRERVPYKGTNECFRCGGEMVPALVPVADVVELPARESAHYTAEEVSAASLEAIALLTACIEDDHDAGIAIVEGSANPTALAYMAGCYGAAAWSLCQREGADVHAVLQRLALQEAQS